MTLFQGFFSTREYDALQNWEIKNYFLNHIFSQNSLPLKSRRQKLTRKKLSIPGLFFVTVLILLMSQPVFARPKVKCAWSKAAVTVDGINKEWIGSLKIIDKNVPALGVSRDEEFLYLGVLFTEPARQRKILTRGMTVWFDPDGGTEKTLGIRFPAGLGDSGMFRDSRPDPGQDPNDREQLESEHIDQIAGEALEKPEYFLILGPEKDQQTQVGFSGIENIEVRAARQDYTLFYELKIPLHRTSTHPFGIGVKSGRKLGIGFETPADDEMRRQGDGGMSGGMGGGMGGGIPGSMGTGIPGSLGTRMPRGMGTGMPGSMGTGMPSGGMGGRGMGGGMGRSNGDEPVKIWLQVEDIESARP